MKLSFKVDPWVSDKHSHGVTLPINDELKYNNVLLPYPFISEFIEKSDLAPQLLEFPIP